MAQTEEGSQPPPRGTEEETPPRGRGLRINPTVFGVSAGAIIAFVAFGAVFTELAGDIFQQVQGYAVNVGGWWLTLAVAFFVVFIIFVATSRFGRIRLGADDEEPEFGYLAWFAMLFSAGMGIGLMFWAVAEPVLHLTDPPHAEPETAAAAQDAIMYTFFHWGIHAWSIYIVMGLALGYMAFRRGKPLTVRYALQPLLGTRLIEGKVGDLVDIIAVFGTMFGIATSLGLGVSQVNAGLNRLGVMPEGDGWAVLLIAIITAIATASVVSGLDKGIKNLSMANITMAGILLLFVVVAGPTLFILNSFVENIGTYVQNIVRLSFETDALGDGEWQAAWPTFYWAWWISWSPFVGMFIARISRGRTIREFIVGVALVPTLVTMLWLTAFGSTAIGYVLQGVGEIAELAGEDESLATYALVEALPVPGSVVLVATAAVAVIVTLFFVTSSDSGSLVIDILTADGDLDPPKAQRLFWAVSEGAVAAVLLLAGGLSALQTAAISTGLPFSVILVAVAFSLLLAFRRDPAAGAARLRRRPGQRAGERQVIDPVGGSIVGEEGTTTPPVSSQEEQ